MSRGDVRLFGAGRGGRCRTGEEAGADADQVVLQRTVNDAAVISSNYGEPGHSFENTVRRRIQK